MDTSPLSPHKTPKRDTLGRLRPPWTYDDYHKALRRLARIDPGIILLRKERDDALKSLWQKYQKLANETCLTWGNLIQLRMRTVINNAKDTVRFTQQKQITAMMKRFKVPPASARPKPTNRWSESELKNLTLEPNQTEKPCESTNPPIPNTGT